MQPIGRRRADVDPGLHDACAVANGHWRLVGIGQASARELDPGSKFATVREHARDEELLGFRRVSRDTKRERLVHAAIVVGEIDVDGVNG